MKKSHRKDVIIARIILAVICIVLIGIIVSVVMLVRGRHNDSKEPQNPGQPVSQETQIELPPPVINELTSEGVETQKVNTQEGNTEQGNTDEPLSDDELSPQIWTNTGVNMRTEPSVESSVITVLNPGVLLELLGEEEGWVKVRYNDYEGYVSTDYITDRDPSASSAE